MPLVKTTTVKKCIHLFLTEIWHRQLPHGLITWRYLLPRQNELIRIHRHLWWNTPTSLPRPLWLLIECWLYIRWVTWFGWRNSWKIACHYEDDTQAESNPRSLQLSRNLQFFTYLKFTYAYCIPPSATRSFQLHLCENDPLNYVYGSEAAAFHRGRDGTIHPEGLAILGDKSACAKIFESNGLSVPQTLGNLSVKDEEPDWTAVNLPIFLKPQHGHGGLDCFQVTRLSITEIDSFQSESPKARVQWSELGNLDQTSEQAYERWKSARQRHQHDAYLIQPCYVNAHALQDALQGFPILGDTATTLRAITRRTVDGVVIDLAYLELPLNAGKHAFFRIDLSSGKLVPAKHLPAKLMISESDMLSLWERLSLAALPHWSQAASASIIAHGTLATDLHSVAWDFLLSDEGALLLEGNATWAVMPPQILAGGFVKLID